MDAFFFFFFWKNVNKAKSLHPDSYDVISSENLSIYGILIMQIALHAHNEFRLVVDKTFIISHFSYIQFQRAKIYSYSQLFSFQFEVFMSYPPRFLQ